LFFIAIVGAGLRAQFLPVRAGRETMVGKVTPALARIDASGGKVFIEGEYWNAVSETVVEKGQPVEVVGFDGLTLKVKPKTP
jgi:membrane-bound serine protease (ClpP class)